MGSVELRPHQVKSMQAAQHWKELQGVPGLLTEQAGPSIRLLHLWGCVTLGGYQRWAQRELQGQFLLGALRGFWQGCEQIKSSTEILNCFHISRARMSVLAGEVPIGYG